MSLEHDHPVHVLILGASYGSLFATKLALAGHVAQMVCLPEESALINTEGTIVRLPVKGHEGLVEIRSKQLPGKVSASVPSKVNLTEFDLVVLAMQEPQYRAPEVRDLLRQVASSRLPTVSIMNMPPLPYLSRIPGLSSSSLAGCYTDASVWEGFDPDLMTLCSPDPQAFRPADEGLNVLQVRLPTNFKAAAFGQEAHTQLLRRLAADIERVRWPLNGQLVELPVKLKVHESIFVPMAKWSMLIAGNYRCITPSGMRPIKEAVHSDLALSRTIYNWVSALCESLGASPEDLVPFEKYAAAANNLASPSSVARALFGGATYIERVDLLVQAIAKSKGLQLPELDAVVSLVNSKLESNRTAHQRPQAA
ncbi:MAG: hypothetical protein KGL63_00320 [Betaproteobacteria bacterium]|nr:hypothetical protein [Betaproteobacteria bacterium]